MSGTTQPAGRRPRRHDADPEDQHGGDGEADPGRRRARPRAPASPTGREPGREATRRRPPSERGSGSDRSRSGPAAQTTTRPASSPTLVPNSLVWGAIRSMLATATSSPNATRPTCPAGTVLGSVIMKNRKIRTSGEVTMTRQKSKPQTGANAQFGGHAVARAGEDPDPDRERDPERRRPAPGGAAAA